MGLAKKIVIRNVQIDVGPQTGRSNYMLDKLQVTAVPERAKEVVLFGGEIEQVFDKVRLFFSLSWDYFDATGGNNIPYTEIINLYFNPQSGSSQGEIAILPDASDEGVDENGRIDCVLDLDSQFSLLNTNAGRIRRNRKLSLKSKNRISVSNLNYYDEF